MHIFVVILCFYSVTLLLYIKTEYWFGYLTTYQSFGIFYVWKILLGKCIINSYNIFGNIPIKVNLEQSRVGTPGSFMETSVSPFSY